MKWKQFCKSDLMIATFFLTELLLISLSFARATSSNQHKQTPNSFYISHRILHNQHQPASGPRSSSSASTSSSPSSASSHSYSSSALHPRSDSYDTRTNLAITSANLNSDTYDAPTAGEAAGESDTGDARLAVEDSPVADSDEHDESADNSHEMPDRNLLMDHHNSHLRTINEIFERRQLNSHQLQAGQELNPIAIGLDPGNGPASPFSMPPFAVPNDGSSGPLSKPMANADNLDQGLGPSLPYGLNPLPHLLGFQNTPFDGPQRGDQSAHSNHHATMPTESDGTGSGQKVWPKIFRFTDGRINLSDFEKSKKIGLSRKNQHNTENHIESAPIMFDGRQLKRKSFLILHGGIFSK